MSAGRDYLRETGVEAWMERVTQKLLEKRPENPFELIETLSSFEKDSFAEKLAAKKKKAAGPKREESLANFEADAFLKKEITGKFQNSHAPPKLDHISGAGVQALLCALALELAVENTEMWRPIPPLAVCIHHMTTAFALLVCNFDSHEVEAISLAGDWKGIGARALQNPMCVVPSTYKGYDCLAAASNKGDIHMWGVTGDETIDLGGNQAGNVQCALVIPNEHRLVVTSFVKKKVFVFDSDTKAEVSSVDMGAEQPWGCVLRDDGIVIVGTSKGVAEVDVKQGKLVASHTFPRSSGGSYGVFGMTKLRDGRVCAADYYDKVLWIFDGYQLDKPSKLKLNFMPHDVVQLPDGDLVISSHTEKQIKIYECPPHYEAGETIEGVCKRVIKGGENGMRMKGPTGLLLTNEGLASAALQ